jgi:dephospho-CoA kinase
MSKTVFAFGRMNPPTIGHEKLADKVYSEAKRRGAMPHIFLSHTQNAKKDPLPYNTKIDIAKKAFGKAVTKSSAKTIIQVMQELEKLGHTEVILVAGSDRVPEFKAFLAKYNGKDYNFDKIEVVSAGERDPDAEGVAGMSASKLRGIAQAGDYDTFIKGMPSKLRDSDKKKVYDTIRSVMESLEEDWEDISDEEFDELFDEIMDDDWRDDIDWSAEGPTVSDDDLMSEERKPLTLQQRMKKRLQMRRLAPIIARKRKIALRRMARKPQLVKRARRAALLFLKKRVAGEKGKQYKTLSPSEKIGIDRLVTKKLPLVDKIARRLLPKMVKKEQERFRNLNKNEEFTNYINELYFKVDVEGLPTVYVDSPSASTVRSNLRKVIRSPEENIHNIERVDRADIVKAFRLRAQNPKAPLDVEEQKTSQDPDVKERPGSQPKKYYSGLRKSTKDDRARHFEKGAKMDDDNPAAYKPAPGDADAETKPSKYTKKYKQMFGEEVTSKQLSDLDEGLNDPGIFKAVFLAGGPGSGKSFIVGRTGLVGLGLKLVNSDPIFELGLKNAGLKTTPEDIYTTKGQSIRDRAKALTKKQQELYLKGRLGLVIDGTGKDYQKIQKQKEQLEAMGYETAMIFVNTDEGTALERNRKRDRSLSDEEVTKMWKSVQNNLDKFQNSFKSKFFIVDNSEGSNFEAATTSVYKKISAWMKQEPRNKFAQNWISQAKSVRGINEAFVQYMYLEEKSLEGLKKKAEKSGISYSILKKVYDRGMAAWRTGHRPGTTPQQWAYARVNSFITGGKTRTTADADLWKNVRKEELSIDEKFSLQFEEGGAGEYGSDKVTKKYKKDTPGETNEGDAMDAAKERHKREKNQLKVKHDREMDAARLRDTRVKNRTTNANEEFEALFNKDLNESFEMAMTSGLGVTYFASDLGIKTHAGFALHPSVVVEEEEEEDEEV